jgi:WhiB family transcriptional regulator, redox-sensing transcriptional regulator
MAQVRRQANLPRPSWGWQDAAECRGEDLVLFFGPDGERQPEREIRERKAKSVCMRCPVRGECLDYAVSRPEKYGTWGGLNEDERASERRRRMRRAASAGISAVA